MQPEVKAIYFSPTNTTKTIIEHISHGLGQKNPSQINLTNMKERENFLTGFDSFSDNTDFFLIGMPVYFGKTPKFLIDLLKKIDGKGKSAIAVSVYGNRDFDIALKQLVSVLDQSNFKVIGAGAFIGEHSFSPQLPISLGRPDKKDLSLATDFGEQIYKNRDKFKRLSPEDVPGKQNMVMQMMPEKMPNPTFHRKKCKDCGLCVASCPMGILHLETKMYKNKSAKKLCLGCMSCVKKCPHNARSLYFPTPVKFLLSNLVLKEAIRGRKEPITILE